MSRPTGSSSSLVLSPAVESDSAKTRISSESGLSRRLSWSRGSVEHIPPMNPGNPLNSDDIYAPSRGDIPEFDHPFEERRVLEPYNFEQPSESSVAHFPDQADEITDDEQHLTSSSHPPWRGEDGYDEEQSVGPPVKGRRERYVGTSTSIGGNALRAISRNFRRVSIRVVDLASTGAKGQAVKLEETPQSPAAARVLEEPLLDLSGSRLRGTTLGLFGPHSSVRHSMFQVLLWQWTEPIILLLISFHAVVLILQSRRSVYPVPRPATYFGTWEDIVLLILFILYSIESFARIIVSGLLVDPDVRWTSLRVSYQDFLPRKRPPVHPHITNDLSEPSLNMGPSVSSTFKQPPKHGQTSTSSTASGWRVASLEQGRSYIGRNSRTLEAPFQLAIEKQRSLAEQGRPYLRHSWNRIDFVSIVSFWIMFTLSVAGIEATPTRHIYIFRALSVLRISRLLGITSGTATIMRSLKKAAPLLVRVAAFILFAIVLFSIVGVQAFQGSYRRSCQLNVDNQSVTWGQSCGGFIDPVSLNVSGYLDVAGNATGYVKGYVCPLGSQCVDTGSNPNNNIESFDNLVYASLQILILTGVNNWSPVMYAMMDAEFFWSSLFFISGVLILNFWLLNLFVAVITSTFSAIREETKKSAFGATIAGPAFDDQDEGWSGVDGKAPRSIGITLKWYNYTSFFWVFLALVSLGFQASRTSTSSPKHINLLNKAELYITFAFDFEIVWRILAHLPDWRLFFRNSRNLLDLFLVIATTIIQIPAISHTSVYPWLTAFQLFRFYRVILAVPRMRSLLFQVFGNMYGLVNMTLFLLLTNVIAGLIAIQLFRGDFTPTVAANTEFTFKQVFNAFLAMYQLFTSENWTNVLYPVAIAELQYKQAVIAIIFLSAWFVFSNFIMLQMFIAVINENFEVAEERKRVQQVHEYVRHATPSSTRVNWFDRWNPYRFLRGNPKAIAVDALPANLVLPMQKSIVHDHRDPRRPRRIPNPSMEHFFESSGPRRQGVAGTLERLFDLNPRQETIPLSNLKNGRRTSSMPQDTMAMDETERHLDILAGVNTDYTIEETQEAAAEAQARKAEFIAMHPTYDKTLWIFSQKNAVRRFFQKMVTPSNGERIFGAPPTFLAQAAFQSFILFAVIGGIIVAAIASPVYRYQHRLDNPGQRLQWDEISEAAFGFTLFVEFIIKVIADGFIFTPNAYVYSIWNLVDFVILWALLGNVIPTLIYRGNISRVGRVLKAFRVLRLITMFGFMRNTFYSIIFAGAARILDAAVLAILYMIPYAVWGLNVFNGLMFSCNDPISTGKADCINEYISTPVNNLGFLAPRAWDNPKTSTRWSFDTFPASLLILFEIVSEEGWIDVLTASMKITSRDKQTSQDASQINGIFFVVYNLLGGAVILTLFVSIIIANFSSRSGMALLTTEQRQWIDLQKLLYRQRPSRRPKSRPTSPWISWCFDRAVNKHGWWSRGMTVVLCLHIINMTWQTFVTGMRIARQWIFFSLALVYLVDIIIRAVGLGKSFFGNGWNLFNVFVVTGILAATVPTLVGYENFVLQQLQKLFLVSMAFKLVQKFDSLNQLFKTAISSLPAILKLFLLWMVMFIFFGIAYIEVFGLTRWNNFETHLQNYRNFENALLMLAFTSTGEGWNQYMHDYAVQYPFCTRPTKEVPYSDCGSVEWAYAFYIIWNILSMYIFVNMFTGVVVENFSYVMRLSGPTSVTREEMRAFKKVWAEFDPTRKGYIQRGQFVSFFSKLSGVFEVRIYPVEATVRNILERTKTPDSPTTTQHPGSLIFEGVNITQLNRILDTINYPQIRRRRENFSRLYHEALVVEEPGKGISFTNVLLLLAHYNLIDDEKALKLDEMLRRQTTTEYVTDRVNLDRVRSLLKMIYLRRKYLSWKEQQAQRKRAKTTAIPEIYVDAGPSTLVPSMAPSTPRTRDITLAGRNSLYITDTPVHSRQGQAWNAGDSAPSSPTRPSRRTSDLGALNADLGSHSESSSRAASPIGDLRDSRVSPEDAHQVLQTLNSSIWGEMMDAPDDD